MLEIRLVRLRYFGGGRAGYLALFPPSVVCLFLVRVTWNSASSAHSLSSLTVHTYIPPAPSSRFPLVTHILGFLVCIPRLGNKKVRLVLGQSRRQIVNCELCQTVVYYDEYLLWIGARLTLEFRRELVYSLRITNTKLGNIYLD